MGRKTSIQNASHAISKGGRWLVQGRWLVAATLVTVLDIDRPFAFLKLVLFTPIYVYIVVRKTLLSLTTVVEIQTDAVTASRHADHRVPYICQEKLTRTGTLRRSTRCHNTYLPGLHTKLTPRNMGVELGPRRMLPTCMFSGLARDSNVLVYLMYSLHLA